MHNINGKNKIALDGVNIVVAEKDCNGEYDYDIINKSINVKKKSKSSVSKYIILSKENGSYKPVYRKDGNAIRAIFTKDDELIKNIIKNN